MASNFSDEELPPSSQPQKGSQSQKSKPDPRTTKENPSDKKNKPGTSGKGYKRKAQQDSENPGSANKPGTPGKSDKRKAQQDSDVCYVHNVSPIRKSNANGKDFFECTLQFTDGAKTGLCMVPNKRQRLADAATTCSPVKMKNFNSAPNGKIWINPPTSINLLKREEADFEHNAALGDDVIVPFADLHHLASGQIISVKAQCHSVGEVHDHQGKQGTVLKQVVLLRDSTRCIQLYLFGDSVNTLDEGKTYILKNVRVYIMKNVMYLNTTLTATFGYTLTTSFETLADPDVHTNIKIVAKIIGVGQFLSSYLCPDCNRKLSLVDDTYHCGSCKMGYSQGSCSNIYSLQLSLKDVANNEIVKVYLQHDAVCMLAAELSLNLKNDKECVKRLFEVNEPMLVTFDFASKCVKSIKIAIESD